MPTQGKFIELKILEENTSINFVNTLDWRGRETQEEYINTYTDLVDWASLTEIINQEESEILKEKAKIDPVKASESLKRAIKLREAAYRTLVQIFFEEKPDTEDMELLNIEMQSMFDYLKLDLYERQLTLNNDIDLSYILRLVVKDLVELMTSEELKRVKRCQSEECGWLFIDSSKNMSRKWCQMKGCGNRAKARRHYERSKQR